MFFPLPFEVFIHSCKMISFLLKSKKELHLKLASGLPDSQTSEVIRGHFASPLSLSYQEREGGRGSKVVMNDLRHLRIRLMSGEDGRGSMAE